MALDPKAGASASALGTPGDVLSLSLGRGRIARVAVILGQSRPTTPGSNTPPEAGRDVGEAIVVCTAPDVCKTPIGSATPPIPYQITGKLGDDANTSRNVFLTGLKAFKFDSVVTHVTGDEPGSATGVKSGTVGDIAEPKTASSIVRVNGQWLVRDGDSFWMNKRNTIGELIYKKEQSKHWPPDEVAAIDDSEAEAFLAQAKSDNAIIQYYETDQEKTGKARLNTAVGATGYASLVRTALGEKPILLAQAVRNPLPGEPVTDVPASPPQYKPAPGTLPTGPAANDKTFEPPRPANDNAPRPPKSPSNRPGSGKGSAILWIITQIADDLSRPQSEKDAYERAFLVNRSTVGDQIIADKNLLWGRKPFPSNPGWPSDAKYGIVIDDPNEEISIANDVLEALTGKPQDIRNMTDGEVKQILNAHSPENAKKAEPASQSQQEATPSASPNPEEGVSIKGKPDPCNPGAHGKNKCPPEQQSHHIVADYILRIGTRLEPGARLPGSPSLDEGPAICLTEDEHRDVHRRMDRAIRAAGGASGTVSFDKVKEIAYDALAKAKPECKGKFEAATDEYFKKVATDALVRAYKTASKVVKEAARKALKDAGWPID